MANTLAIHAAVSMGAEIVPPGLGEVGRKSVAPVGIEVEL